MVVSEEEQVGTIDLKFLPKIVDTDLGPYPKMYWKRYVSVRKRSESDVRSYMRKA